MMKRCFLLVVVALALTGCWDGDDDNSSGPVDSGGDYETYWGVIEEISVGGYVPEMTQKPEPPVPPSD